jgi:5-oxoprolinase (ATP-hydrolysing)
MTNTRITDPEILELRYPVRLQTFHIRPNSGGRGKWNGGDGITRRFLFNDTVQVSILSQHRTQKPYGLKGGSAGKTGNQYRVDKAGNKHAIKGMESLIVKAGESIVINTPGGGAWGIKKP